MALQSRRLGNDRGAILVHVAMSLMALMAFSAFTIDYGVLWASRRQAQNAADAAALAAAVAYSNDASKNTSDAGPAKSSAVAFGQANLVWGQSPSIVAASDVTFPLCPDDGTATCVRVATYRTTARGNGLPVFFGQLFGLANHDVQATATAKLVAANSSLCMMPWAVPDLFEDTGSIVGEYDPGDNYDPGAFPDNPGTGFSTETEENGGHYGTRVTLKNGPHSQVSPGWFKPLDFGSGGKTYEEAIAGCINTPFGIGSIVPEESGNKQGPTQQGVGALIDKDPEAYWDGTKIVGSCVDLPDDDEDYCGDEFTVSPRVVPVPVFDPEYFYNTGDVKITKILGYFVECVNEAKADCTHPVDEDDYPVGVNFDPKFDILGILINVPGIFSGGFGPAGPGTFLQTVILIR